MQRHGRAACREQRLEPARLRAVVGDAAREFGVGRDAAHDGGPAAVRERAVGQGLEILFCNAGRAQHIIAVMRSAACVRVTARAPAATSSSMRRRRLRALETRDLTVPIAVPITRAMSS